MLVTLQIDPEITDVKMLIRARNAVWMSKRAIGIRGLAPSRTVGNSPFGRIFLWILTFDHVDFLILDLPTIFDHSISKQCCARTEMFG
jgi:hypothetical protein